jgi:dihydroorotate dehydrogenase
VIIGVGGIFNALSAKRMYEAGADLIEIYTSFIYRGSKVIKELS